MQSIVLILIFISFVLPLTGCLDEPKVDLCGVIYKDKDGHLTAECVPQDGSLTYLIKGREMLGFTCTSTGHTAAIKSHHSELHERLDDKD